VLLAPLSLDAHAYLRQLSLTAQHVRQDGLVDAVASKRTAEEARAELLTATQSDVAADTSQA
jgi:hypothetical protein